MVMKDCLEKNVQKKVLIEKHREYYLVLDEETGAIFLVNEVKAFLAEMDLNGISIFNVGSNTVTLASGWDLMAFIRQMISPENGGDAQ